MRAFNFAAGPATLPVEVLEQAREELTDWQGLGASVMEVSHRGKPFLAMAREAESDLRELLGVPANYRVLFMQGGGGTEGSVPAATGTNAGSAGANFGITNGYAVASQDGGHENNKLALASCDSGYGNANEFYLDPLGLIDQAYQSIDVTA